MKRKSEAGFSLVEVLVAIALLGIVVIPTCSALVMSFRMNAKTDEMMQAQLAVSSAVETLMAEGITHPSVKYDMVEYNSEKVDRFPEVTVKTTAVDDKPYYTVEVASEDGLVSVKTTIRAEEPAPTEPAATEEGEEGA